MFVLDLTRVWAEPHAGLPHALRGMGAIDCWRVTDTGNPTVEATSVGAASVNSETRATRLPAGDGLRGMFAVGLLGDVVSAPRLARSGEHSREEEPGGESGLSRLFTLDDDVLGAAWCDTHRDE